MAEPDTRRDAYEFFDGQARASSVLEPGTGKYEAALALDGDPSTAWCWPPPAEGAAAIITFPSERLVERIEIIPGYDKVHPAYGSVWQLNNRVRQVEIEVADGRRIQAELEDAPRLQPILITPPALTNWCRVEIQSVYPGSRWRDSAISEIKVWGYEAEEPSSTDLGEGIPGGRVQVPDVLGMGAAAARSLLRGLGLNYREGGARSSEEVVAGGILSQDPEAGRQVTPGSTVTVVLSEGPSAVMVPDVTNMSIAQAQRNLEAAGLVSGEIRNAHSADVPAGYVVSTLPASGARVVRGLAVDLMISSGRAVQ